MLTDDEFERLRKTLIQWVAKRGEWGVRVAEDVTQMALLRLWEHVNEGEEIRDPLGWCRTFVLRAYTRQSARIERDINLDSSEVWSPQIAQKLILHITPEDILAGKEEFALIPDRLKALTILRDEDEEGNVLLLTGTERVALHRLRTQMAHKLGRIKEK